MRAEVRNFVGSSSLYIFILFLNSVASSTCPDLHTLFMNVQATNLYVAAYSNPSFSNASTDWLPVITCTSELGSPASALCQLGLLVNLLSTGVCYVRLDIQIAYTNIGTIENPQAVLSAVIFNYQRIVRINHLNYFPF